MLHPHLHLLVPALDGILLETRVYLPIREQAEVLPLSTEIKSVPIRYNQLDSHHLAELKRWDIDTLITAAHPWQKLGGNMLDPVLSQYLTSAIFQDTSRRVALVTFNCRGVGRSGGSIGWFGLNTIPGERDFGAIEACTFDLFRPQIVKRVGYSWGSVAALNAPQTVEIHSTLLISPPSTLFSLTTLVSSRTFCRALKEAGKVVIVHGTRDQFTSATAYEGLAGQGVTCSVVDGADHFYRDRQSARGLMEGVGAWLDSWV